jgi:hypothetical protein
MVGDTNVHRSNPYLCGWRKASVFDIVVFVEIADFVTIPIVRPPEGVASEL